MTTAYAYNVEIIADPTCPAGYYTNVYRVGTTEPTSLKTPIHRVVARNKDEALAKVIVALTSMNEGDSPFLSYSRVR